MREPAFTEIRPAVRSAWRFPLLLALALVALLTLFKPYYGGDVVEYSLATVAVADHGSPDIRLDDIARVRTLIPGMFTEPFDWLERDMRAGSDKVYPAFVRGRDGDVFPVHFFGYSLLAAPAFKLFEALGVPPFKAFQAVNLAAIFVLGLALRRFFGSERQAWLGLGLFMLCGGALYWHWTSPECVSAAALLAALLLFNSGAPLAACLLAGLAGQQNPTIVFFFAFAPLLRMWLDWQPGIGLVANVRRQISVRLIVALACGVAMIGLPPLFNLIQFGTPNIIARLFTDPGHIGAVRLLSFYFDLNQGMIVGVPALLAGLLLWVYKSRARMAAGLVLALLFTLALALPALAINNWNSGAAGVMRYAFWAAMPLLFVFCVLLRDAPRWPRALVIGVFACQAAAMAHAASYSYVSFSPVARGLLAVAPQLYHPEPEIFAERANGNDDYIWPNKIYTYQRDGVLIKAVINDANPRAEETLCGPEMVFAPDVPVTPTARGWRYVDGPLRCVHGGYTRHNFGIEALRAGQALRLADGWSTPESDGADWHGVWSTGARSRLHLKVGGAPVESIHLTGAYHDRNRQTRVTVNGVDLGWHALDREGALALPANARGPELVIELEHTAPSSPGPNDGRLLAFFLREVSVRQPVKNQP
jgi:hypothetical protein